MNGPSIEEYQKVTLFQDLLNLNVNFLQEKSIDPENNVPWIRNLVELNMNGMYTIGGILAEQQYGTEIVPGKVYFSLVRQSYLESIVTKELAQSLFRYMKVLEYPVYFTMSHISTEPLKKVADTFPPNFFTWKEKRGTLEDVMTDRDWTVRRMHTPPTSFADIDYNFILENNPRIRDMFKERGKYMLIQISSINPSNGSVEDMLIEFFRAMNGPLHPLPPVVSYVPPPLIRLPPREILGAPSPTLPPTYRGYVRPPSPPPHDEDFLLPLSPPSTPRPSPPLKKIVQ